MRKFREANFSAHPALSHILNLHLQDNIVTKSELTMVTKKIKYLAEGGGKTVNKGSGQKGHGEERKRVSSISASSHRSWLIYTCKFLIRLCRSGTGSIKIVRSS
jgi:hypothetical protein